MVSIHDANASTIRIHNPSSQWRPSLQKSVYKIGSRIIFSFINLDPRSKTFRSIVNENNNGTPYSDRHFWENVRIFRHILNRYFSHRIAQPVFLGKLVDYYTPKKDNEQEIGKQEAYLYAGAVVLCSALNVFVVHPYMQAILHMGMKFRVACCSLIYRKVSNCNGTFIYKTSCCPRLCLRRARKLIKTV